MNKLHLETTSREQSEDFVWHNLIPSLCLEIMSQTIELGEHEVNVFCLNSWIGDDVPEKIRLAT